MKYQNEINEVIKFGGYLNLGRCAWSLYIGEHRTSETSSISSCVSGYYGMNGLPSDDLFQRCLDSGIPILDSRSMNLTQACEYIKGPLIHYSKEYQITSDKISLVDFIKNKKHLGLKHFNIQKDVE